VRDEALRWDDVEEVDAVLVEAGAEPDFAALGEALAELRKPVFLGGLTPENVREAIEKVRPYAVDVAAGVEGEPGKKDPAKVRAFVAAARKAGNRYEE
jgi:phosphoribosylanthranilate isomerase